MRQNDKRCQQFSNANTKEERTARVAGMVMVYEETVMQSAQAVRECRVCSYVLSIGLGKGMQ